MHRQGDKILAGLAAVVLTAVGGCSGSLDSSDKIGDSASGVPVTSLKVMSFNVWVGASNVSNGPTKVLNAIRDAGADIVAMQESRGLAEQIATELGWYSEQAGTSVAVLSRYPITQTLGIALNDAGLGVRVQLGSDPSQNITVWSAHLTAFPYGPYDACLTRLSTTEIIARQESTQLPEIEDILRQLQTDIANADNAPVLLIGDMNTASHLDWTQATTDLHCGYTLNFPVTAAIEQAGLVDAYRSLHPDPRVDRGNTWSPIYQTFVYEGGTPEPQDRIDMVHYAGAAVTLQSASVFVLGTPAQYPNHQDNEWPSDHAALVVTMNLVPP